MKCCMKEACLCFNACKESNGQTKMPSEYEFKFTKSPKILFVKLYYKNFISAQED